MIDESIRRVVGVGRHIHIGVGEQITPQRGLQKQIAQGIIIDTLKNEIQRTGFRPDDLIETEAFIDIRKAPFINGKDGAISLISQCNRQQTISIDVLHTAQVKYSPMFDRLLAAQNADPGWECPTKRRVRPTVSLRVLKQAREI
ncbi:hypothetical protein D9M68_590320 [compost metagenome]